MLHLPHQLLHQPLAFLQLLTQPAILFLQRLIRQRQRSNNLRLLHHLINSLLQIRQRREFLHRIVKFHLDTIKFSLQVLLSPLHVFEFLNQLLFFMLGSVLCWRYDMI